MGFGSALRKRSITIYSMNRSVVESCSLLQTWRGLALHAMALGGQPGGEIGVACGFANNQMR
jgi:hypothetical protein